MVLKAYQKINHRIIGIGLLALFFYSCNKLSKEEIGVRIIAKVPYDNTPIPGVKYRIVEMQPGKKMFEEEETGWVLEGKTDANGRADVIFNPKKNDKYYHYIYFDYSEAELPMGNWVFINAPSFKNVQRDYFSVNNTTEIRALPKTGIHWVVENKNCFDENDKMRFKVFNIDEFPYKTFDQIVDWGSYYEGGCGIKQEYSNSNVTGGRRVYLLEITRNGQVTEKLDTFLLMPNTVNEVHIKY